MRTIEIPNSAIEKYATLNPQNWDDIGDYGAQGYQHLTGHPITCQAVPADGQSIGEIAKMFATVSASTRQKIMFYADVYLGAQLLVSTDTAFPAPSLLFSAAPLMQCAKIGRCIQEINRETKLLDNPEIAELIRGNDDEIPALCKQIKELMPRLTSIELLGFLLLREPLPPEIAAKSHMIFAKAFGEAMPQKPFQAFEGPQGIQ